MQIDADPTTDPMRSPEALRLAEILMAHRLGGSTIPAGLHRGLVAYLICGLRPGAFLTAVLEDSLHRAMQNADRESLAGLPAIVSFLYFEAPSDAWGSPARVSSWVASRGWAGGAR